MARKKTNLAIVPPAEEPAKPLRIIVGDAGLKQENWLTAGLEHIKPDTVFNFKLSGLVDPIHGGDPTRWPWKDESVDQIMCPLYFNTLTGRERVRFMNEAYRVLKTGSQMAIIVPYWSSYRAVQDPFIPWPPVCEQTFAYFNQGFLKSQNLTHSPYDQIKCDFDYAYGADWENDTKTKNSEVQSFQMKRYLNSVDNLHVTLTKKAPS